jgi:methylthioribose-1-phosphate isomerase
MAESIDTHVYPVVWQSDHIVLIDQRQLPGKYVVVSISRCDDVQQAIAARIVQGGSALGIAAAYGLYLGARDIHTSDRTAFWERLEAIGEQFKALRPDKANLQWAVDRALKAAKEAVGSVEDARQRLFATAQAIQAEDFDISYAIGRHGLAALPSSPEKLTLLTHCNHGALATSGFGTSLGIIRTAWLAARIERIYVGETRPNFQGARLTAWECLQEGIPVTVMADSMAAACMQQGIINAVVVGADRIAANGDTLNKVGTYSIALAAQAHQIPFLVAAPLSTVDFSLNSGNQVKIPERPAAELYQIGDTSLRVDQADYYNPSSDVTPARLITAIITEQGAISPDELVNWRDRQP